MSAFSRFLAHRRIWIFAVMLCLVAAAALLVPHIVINTDMTKYLPDDYPMKQGLDVVRVIPGMEEQIQSLGSSFGNGADLMPSNLPRTLAIGVSLLFMVLLVMYSSFMEVLLFLVTALCAVILNMGTNALLPSVSLITNNLTPVLQMVLSMDYSIILMNRYRQERGLGNAPSPAISEALRTSMPAILSSAFTTIVSLLMLNFIKLKIGSDLGMVLAKGVAFSLICNFTVLPALIVWADKSVIFKTKKTPKFPSAKVAGFQTRWRVPLALLFVAVVALAAVFQSRTPIIFQPHWKSKATDVVREDNPFLLVYETANEAVVPDILKMIEQDCNVRQTISYPTTLGKECTAEQMGEMMSGFMPDVMPDDLLKMVYYARSHPDLDGRLSFAEIEAAADRLSAAGMMPEGVCFEKMAAQLMQQAAPKPQPKVVTEPEPEPEPVPETEVLPERDSVAQTEQPTAVSDTPQQTAAQEDSEASRLTYEDVTLQRTAKEVAAFMEADTRQITTVYRLAGKAGKTMSLEELYLFVKNELFTNKRYSAFIPKDARQGFESIGVEIEKALAAGPSQKGEPEAVAENIQEPLDSVADTPLEITETAPEPEPAPEPAPEPEPEPEHEPTPLDRLIDMMVSGRKYTAAQVYSALSAAGADVSQDDIELLFLYTLSGRDYDPAQTVTPEQLLYYVADTLLAKPALARVVSDDVRVTVMDAKATVEENASKLRGEHYSFALVSTSYPMESDSTFAFVKAVNATADSLLPGTHYWIGESEMYKEIKDNFPSELLLLTILTVLAIYLIVALTFRSLLIPIPLVLSVLTGVYVNVAVSGIGGGSMYYLAYLIIQGILMGAAIDYSILFTSYFRSARKTMGVGDAIRSAFEGSSHSVLTSGLILTLVPMVMSFVMGDPMIASILKSLSIGALAAVLIILFLLPAVLAVMDPIISRNKRNK
ncbi:MAG: MMPL family transporter [Bacteroidales bacterium]|nr:MMPL family transporter [Bacteroidales bacterium]